MEQSAVSGTAAFAHWLRDHIQADGRSALAISRASGVQRSSLYRVINDSSAGMFETTVRQLASFFGADPDEVAALAGHCDVRISAPSPRQFATVADWLRASIEARNESAEHAALGAGLNSTAVQKIIRTGWMPKRPTLDKLADFFRVSRIEIRALRRPLPTRIAAGKKVAAKLGVEHMRAISEKGRAQVQLTTEQRREIGRLAGTTTAQRHGSDLYRKMQTAAAEVIRRRGHLHTSDESRARYLEKVRGVVGTRRARLAWETRRARYPTEHIREVATAAAASKKDGSARARMVAYFAIGRLWSRVNASSDLALKARIQKQVRAQRDYLREPVRRGKPPTLLRDKDLAINAAVLHDDLGLSAREIGELAGFKISKDQRGYHSQARSAWELIRFGRALRGQRRAS